MSRIPDDEIDRIKQEVDLAALIRSRGIELKKHGSKDLIGLCPFHGDRQTPNLVVTPAKNLWHCPACNKGGTVIDFVMRFDGLGFRHAVEVLREKPGALLNNVRERPINGNHTRHLDSPVEADKADPELMGQVIDYYHEQLLKSPEALDYLEKRGIRDMKAIERFRLGYANRTLGLRLPPKQLKAGKEMRDRLTTLGIYRETGHEHFNGCIVFPIFNQAGHVSEIYGRKVGKQKNKIYHLYLPGPHVGLFNPEAFESKTVILCESIIDALSFWVNGFVNVTTAYGRSGFTGELKQAFIGHKTEKVLIAYDRDKAGDEGAASVAEALSPYGIECYRVQFPHGQDANDYARKVKPPRKALDLVLRSSQWMGKGRRASAGNDEASPQKDASCAPSSLVAKAANVSSSEPPKEPEPSAPAKPAEAANEAAKIKKLSAPDEVQSESQGDDLFVTIGDRVYRVRGLAKNASLEVLKVNLRVNREGDFYLDQIDLYHARQRESYTERAAVELRVQPEMLKRDLGKLILHLEELQEQRLIEALKPKTPEVELEEKEREAALELLKLPDLLDRILADFDHCGIVGEATNKLAGYVATVSRKLDRPLAVIIQSTSAAGKSTLMEAILSFLPSEEQIKYSAMTGQSLYYLGETNLKHKILAIVEEEGAEKASYALKLLQSEGELTIASTGKDPNTGRMETQEYHVEGPVMIFLTTTAIEIDEELLNRCLVLTVDESKAQTEAIHRLQREAETFAGLKRKVQREQVLTVHRNAQRLLKPLHVVNPYAPQLTFLSHSTRTRRDHMKYLTLIKSIALLHQYQRPLKERDGIQFIEVEKSDIEAAGGIARDVLSRSLDELPPQTRRLLDILAAWVKEQCGKRKIEQEDFVFTRRQVRELTGWSNSQVKVHLDRLEDLEYICRHRGSFGVTFEYVLTCDPDKPTLPGVGLIDVEKLDVRGYDANLADSEDNLAEQNDDLAGPCEEDDRKGNASDEAA